MSVKNISVISVCIFSAFLFLVGCSDNNSEKSSSQESNVNTQQFTQVPASESGINFNNSIQETPTVNYMYYDGIYQGAGVGILDVNNDDLPDIYFAGNMTENKLYLNKGNFEFEDISTKAGVNDQSGWSSGVTVVDINNDGYDDLYVCRFLLDEPSLRKDLFYINNGDNTFTEKAEAYGLADEGYTIEANFFDANNDGLLDLYVGNQPPTNAFKKKELRGKKDYRYSDKFYFNLGNGKFQESTVAAGFLNYTFTLSVNVSDLNNDGWQDVYVSCDYEEPDMMYINNKDGTFTNVTDKALKHMSNFSMGVDIADINNDGYQDLFVADMVAHDNLRLKTNMGGMNPTKFWNLANNGYHFQYMYNSLQLNNGAGGFSEIAQLSGVSNTDWSWSPLLADFDLDGDKDLYVTNGLKKDMRNKDYEIKRKKFVDQKIAAGINPADGTLNPLEVLALAPSEKIANFAFENNNDLTFSKVTESWGLGGKNWSHGAAYADLDKDGDLDLILNNMEGPALIYRNNADKKGNNYLQIKLEGKSPNINGIGAKVTLKNGEKIQVAEMSPTRGYLSTSEQILSFGLGDESSIESLTINWPDGTAETIQNVKSNQRLTLYQKNGSISPVANNKIQNYKEVASQIGLEIQHKENEFDDYEREILIPYKMSTLGPVIAKADVNGDGLEDVFVGSSAGTKSELFFQTNDGNFNISGDPIWNTDKKYEDTGALFFDADGDGDQDLYIASGSNEFKEGSSLLNDRIYFNNGKGQFSKKGKTLPALGTSTSHPATADIDGDGDLDLFIGGRQIPGKYGVPASSFILKNDGGKFTDITASSASFLKDFGMVTDGIFADLDGDNDKDLIVIGEWMPISILINKDGVFENRTEAYGLGESTGWWNKIEVADLDNDGDSDFVVGNLGLNIKYKASQKEPFKCFVKDFDDNGTHDVYLGYYDQDGVCYPVRGRECSSQQMPFIKKKFESYQDFGLASIDRVLEGKMDGATALEAQIFESIILENKGDSKFNIIKLPSEAQFAPTFGIIIEDRNNDGKKDLLLAGNYYNREIETTRSDAGIGCLLLNQGGLQFSSSSELMTGFMADQDVRDIELIEDKQGNKLIIVANNNAPVQVFQLQKTQSVN